MIAAGRRKMLAAAADADAALRRDDYRGYDPYDALRSPLFRLPVLRSSRRLRFAAQQALRRSPMSLRPLLGIRKGLNPVTVGLALHAYALLGDPEERAAGCVAELARLASPGWSGACWGYDFDWESRRVSLPAFTPTVVATGIAANGLFAAYELLGRDDALDLCAGAARFATRDLNRSVEGRDEHCWSYSPLDRQRVPNASLKGARVCAQVASATGDGELREAALSAARFVARRQRPDGSWPYAFDDPRGWVDHFHTGYVLECLHEVARRTGTDELDDALARGFRFYRERLFEGPVPKYYADRLHPIDSTACAQAILTLCAFGEVAAAETVADWTLANMRRDDGGFVYRVHRRRTDRTHYARWSTAWMLAALARLARELGP